MKRRNFFASALASLAAPLCAAPSDEQKVEQAKRLAAVSQAAFSADLVEPVFSPRELRIWRGRQQFMPTPKAGA